MQESVIIVLGKRLIISFLLQGGTFDSYRFSLGSAVGGMVGKGLSKTAFVSRPRCFLFPEIDDLVGTGWAGKRVNG